MGVLPALGFPLALFGLGQRKYPAGAGFVLALLTAFGPLAFFDPIELNMYGLFSGEAAKWAFTATTWTVTLGWIALFLAIIVTDKLLRPILRAVWGGLAVVAAVGAVVVYLLVGQPGFFGDDFFVVMSSQAALSRAKSIADVDERRAWVYETLVEHADVSQKDLREWLDARGIPYTPYYLTNGVEVHASAIRRWQIGRRSDVLKIVYSPELRPIPELPEMMPGTADKPVAPTWGLEAIGVPRVWKELGVTGKGVVIGQSDSGVDATHPALADGYRGSEMGSDDYNWLDPWFGKPQPYDINGHGTHTLATAAGDDLVGVAPDAEWFACANLVRTFGSPAYYLTCMQFMLAPYPQTGDPLRDGKPELAADVSTNSWGCPARIEGCDEETLWFATEALRDAGIFFVAAVGNEGPACDSMQTPPGNYANTIMAVGALRPDGDIADFSNRGPETLSPDGAIGPDLLAPGVEVLSAWPGDGWNSIEGTSMAAPHVAGVVALMWSANPALRGNIEVTERILLETASPYQGIPDDCSQPGQLPDPAFGYGVVNAYEAVKAALAWQP
jgi:subtilisin family serine protease